MGEIPKARRTAIAIPIFKRGKQSRELSADYPHILIPGKVMEQIS